jgi:hypothetical protein
MGWPQALVGTSSYGEEMGDQPCLPLFDSAFVTQNTEARTVFHSTGRLTAMRSTGKTPSMHHSQESDGVHAKRSSIRSSLSHSSGAGGTNVTQPHKRLRTGMCAAHLLVEAAQTFGLWASGTQVVGKGQKGCLLGYQAHASLCVFSNLVTKAAGSASSKRACHTQVLQAGFLAAKAKRVPLQVFGGARTVL